MHNTWMFEHKCNGNCKNKKIEAKQRNRKKRKTDRSADRVRAGQRMRERERETMNERQIGRYKRKTERNKSNTFLFLITINSISFVLDAQYFAVIKSMLLCCSAAISTATILSWDSCFSSLFYNDCTLDNALQPITDCCKERFRLNIWLV